MNTLAKGWFTELSPEERNDFIVAAAEVNGAHTADDSSESCSKNFKSDGNDISSAWPGQAFSLKVDHVLLQQRTKYQDILVFQSNSYGKVLVLDGIIQCTERDEFAYQEMLTHLPMCSHPNPKKVLIVGGGDGGVLREVLKHSCVDSVTMCEIDQGVIDTSKKFFPQMAVEFCNPKLNLYIGDGHEFIKKHPNEFDVIITDSSDPIGPAESLFGESYYKLLQSALTDDGVLSAQAESIWLHLDLVQHMVSFSRALFPQVAYANGMVPTYPSGCIGYLICSKNGAFDVRKPMRIMSAEEIKGMKLRYYNSAVHEAAFTLPQFVKEALEG